MMSLAVKMFAATSIVTLAICAFGPESRAQRANAAAQSAQQAPHLLPAGDRADRLRIAQARRQIERKPAPVPIRASPQPLLFLSDAYMKNEKQTEDRLKRVMTICKGC
jgi:hypothetical protein